MMFLLVNGTVIAGACILIASLVPVRRLISQLPFSLRRKWYFLTLLILFFIVGYIGYIATHWNEYGRLSYLMEAAVFFFGACFVFLVNSFSLQTAVDVRRMVTLEKESVTDPLMGLYNRRYLDSRLEDEVARSHRYKLPLSILLIDVDNFKQVNDTCGHQVGDLVLTQIGELISDTIRDSDIAVRYGGDEILVAAPNTPVSDAFKLAERLRKRVESFSWLQVDETICVQMPCVTISIGVTCVCHMSDDVRLLVERADDALHRAKSEGRNRVIIREKVNPIVFSQNDTPALN